MGDQQEELIAAKEEIERLKVQIKEQIKIRVEASERYRKVFERIIYDASDAACLDLDDISKIIE